MAAPKSLDNVSDAEEIAPADFHERNPAESGELPNLADAGKREENREFLAGEEREAEPFGEREILASDGRAHEITFQ